MSLEENGLLVDWYKFEYRRKLLNLRSADSVKKFFTKYLVPRILCTKTKTRTSCLISYEESAEFQEGIPTINVVKSAVWSDSE